MRHICHAPWTVALTCLTHVWSVSSHCAPEFDIRSVASSYADPVIAESEHSILGRATAQLCGNQTGVSCPTGQCCGINGYCGTTEDYCKAPDCQFAFGSACDANAVPSGPSTLSLARPNLGSVVYGGVTIRSCVKPGVVAMTYDDGPSPYTSELLDTLAAANVKATFFVTGNNNGKGEIDNPSLPWPAIIRRMYSDGHQIASHTWSHASLDSLTSAQRATEMGKNEMAFRNILGFFPTYMRPPYTYCTASTGCLADMAKLGYHVVDYDVDTDDWENQTPALIQNSKNNVAKALANSNPNSQEFLIYGHDIYQQTVESLTPYILNIVKSKGFKMVTIGECLNDPVQNWYRNATNGGAITSFKLANSGGNSASASASASASSVISSSTSSTKPTTSSSVTTSSTSGVSSSGSSTLTSAQSMSSTHAATTSTSTTQSTAASSASQSKTNDMSSVSTNWVLSTASLLLLLDLFRW